VPASAGKSTRGHFLQPAWTGEDSIRERFDAVADLISASSVLDIGCASRHRRSDWLHGLLADRCSDLVGIDVDEPSVATLKARGFDVRLEDARDFDLGREFEVVFAGELIEHLDDVRGFLQSARRHIQPKGRLVLTTPNPFYFANFIYRFGGHALVHREHTCWFCEDTIKRVLAVNGFDEIEVSFTGHKASSKLRSVLGGVARFVLPPRLALDTLVVVAQPST